MAAITISTHMVKVTLETVLVRLVLNIVCATALFLFRTGALLPEITTNRYLSHFYPN